MYNTIKLSTWTSHGKRSKYRIRHSVLQLFVVYIDMNWQKPVMSWTPPTSPQKNIRCWSTNSGVFLQVCPHTTAGPPCDYGPLWLIPEQRWVSHVLNSSSVSHEIPSRVGKVGKHPKCPVWTRQIQDCTFANVWIQCSQTFSLLG